VLTSYDNGDFLTAVEFFVLWNCSLLCDVLVCWMQWNCHMLHSNQVECHICLRDLHC